nr:MAG TPA: hypothetical protein [Caudoviricetes sp.]
MLNLSGFKPLAIKGRKPLKMSITYNGVTFGKNVVEELNKCRYCKVLINFSGRKLLIVESSENEEFKRDFCISTKARAVRLYERNLLHAISGLMGWKLSIDSYRVVGTYHPEVKGVLFDLNKAVKLR